MSSCDECGSHDIQPVDVHGLVVEECGLCGHLQGRDEVVRQVEELREADALGVPPALIGLFQALESIPGVTVERSISSAAGERTPPAIFFQLRQRPMPVLDRLARTLVLACRSTHSLWTVEVTHQGRLWFVLRPRLFHGAAELTKAESESHVTDLAILRDCLRRDLQLAWWDLGND